MSEDAAWIGRETVQHDVATAAPIRGLAALLDRADGDPDIVPPLAHGLYFLPRANQSALGIDGHPLTGSDLPSFGLPRRMWAGSRVSFHASIAIGMPLERRTRITAISRKKGTTGDLAFVTLRHEIAAGGVAAMTEEQDLVYREAANGPAPSPSAPAPVELADGAIVRTCLTDPILLFRFSALTFNAHRIHYDRDYARNVEGHRDLVVHGPLQAMLLMDLFRSTCPERAVTRFTFRAKAPLVVGEEAFFGMEPFREDLAMMWVRTSGGETMAASIRSYEEVNSGRRSGRLFSLKTHSGDRHVHCSPSFRSAIRCSHRA